MIIPRAKEVHRADTIEEISRQMKKQFLKMQGLQEKEKTQMQIGECQWICKALHDKGTLTISR